MPNLLVVIASTRPGRIGKPIGDWFAEQATEHDGFKVTVADLAELDLPLMNEPNHPRLKNYTFDHTKQWSAIVDAADAVVFVTPEYNYAMTAPLKNAIDYLSQEWAYKPVGFVSYGGMSGGIRAVQMAKQVTTVMRMTAAGDGVVIPMAMTMVKDGEFTPTQIVADSAKVMLDELVRLTEAHAPLRSANS